MSSAWRKAVEYQSALPAISTSGRSQPASYRRTPADWHVLVSFLVSFIYVRNRSARITEDGQPRSRTLLNRGGRTPTDLESVLKPAKSTQCSEQRSVASMCSNYVARAVSKHRAASAP